MSRFQAPYNQAKKKESIAAVPQIQKDIKDYENAKRNATDPMIKKAFDARIKALKIKMQSYKVGDPVRESFIKEAVDLYCDDCEKNNNKEIKSPSDCPFYDKDECPYQTQIDAYQDMIDFERRDLEIPEIEEDSAAAVTTTSIGSPTIGDGEGGTMSAPFGNSSIYAPSMGVVTRYGKTFPPKKNGKKKKKLKEFVEHYFNEEKEDHRLDVEKEFRKAKKEGNAEKAVYYSQLGNSIASASFEVFKGSWAYEEWKKKNKDNIEKMQKEIDRFSYMGI